MKSNYCSPWAQNILLCLRVCKRIQCSFYQTRLKRNNITHLCVFALFSSMLAQLHRRYFLAPPCLHFDAEDCTCSTFYVILNVETGSAVDLCLCKSLQAGETISAFLCKNVIVYLHQSGWFWQNQVNNSWGEKVEFFLVVWFNGKCMLLTITCFRGSVKVTEASHFVLPVQCCKVPWLTKKH